MAGVIIKAYLWNQYQNVKRVPILIINLFVITFGLLFLLMMAWAPLNSAPTTHITGTFLGVTLCWIAMLIDTFLWLSLWRSVDSPNDVSLGVVALTAYSRMLSIASLCFMVAYTYWYYYQYATDSGQRKMRAFVYGSFRGSGFEWLFVYSLLLQFMTQSAHGVTFLFRVNRYESLKGVKAAKVPYAESECARLNECF